MKSLKRFLLQTLFLIGTLSSSAQNLAPLQDGVTRSWIGPEYFTNPLMNWRLSNGRIENTHGGWVNEVHALTHQLKEGNGDFSMRVRLGLMEGQSSSQNSPGFVGFKFGAVGHRNDYRSNILHDLESGFAEELIQEPPLQAGFSTDGRLLIGSAFSESLLNSTHMKDAVLELNVVYAAKVAKVRLTVSVSGKEIAFLESAIERESLSGNVALACHGLNPPMRKRRDANDLNHPKFWFSDWELSGEKFSSHPEQTFGPILWSQYTLHNNTLKLMAFFVPMEDEAKQTAELQVRSGSRWSTVAKSTIEPLSRAALFRVDDWDSTIDHDYRVTYRWNSTDGEALASWSGTVRKDPMDKETIVMVGLSCSHSELFPNQFLVENLLLQDPDLVFFSGDQIYETNGGYWTVLATEKEEVPRATLNYLGKFWLSILGFRDLLKDRPTVMVPDDHDVFSNDLWGKSGMAMGKDRCWGGYRMHPDWVNMVEYTQMGNRPDPYDPTPIEQGIRVYTTSLDVGGVSFALINDRKFKSAPGDVIDAMEPLFAMRGERNIPVMDTINEKEFDTRNLDREDLQILGERQLDFLRDWAQNGAALRAVLHQSPFCQPHHLMLADMDSNGWPQAGRNRALEVIREANAVMVNGDLHFASLVQQGIDDWEDAGWSFTLPAVLTQTHRAWRPGVQDKFFP
ncbi:MAG: alkaline phosphatase D family protein [Verrucomicrobia bacterium]|nr:alkaline phosphatase D family protein [Verrucomicrobiota bacterium]